MNTTTDFAALRAAARLPANKSDPKTVVEFFRTRKDIIAQVLPRHLTPERMLRIALTAVRSNPRLMDCTLESLAGAVVTCGILGLEPNPYLGHVYLVPFRNIKKGITEVQVVPGYKGLIQLHMNTGMIAQFTAHPVFERDEFMFEYGTESFLRHRPARQGGDLIASYALARIRGCDSADFEVCWLEHIETIRKTALAKLAKDWQKEQSPWNTHFAEMARKTAIRRLSKRLPVSVEISRMMGLDAQAEAGEPQALDLDAVLAEELSIGTGNGGSPPPDTPPPETPTT